ncbi:hypothetical protein [Bartonella sp. WD12.1]|uniref:hypothetical protein n=1 Tax=Bartonella sp. WD12.1 TaxID=1933903 RepID=UPI0009D14D6F|nr:hypothetical protein [Bartonella sp. WD12.1]OPB29469.1 hypothetical protein BWD121_004890 [Bartonella sp. WD12.1]
MKFIKRFFCKKPQQPIKKHFVSTVHGYEAWFHHDESWELVWSECFYNLYEDEDGRRTFERFKGRYYRCEPNAVDFSVRAQIDAWIHGGDLPKTGNTGKDLTN